MVQSGRAHANQDVGRFPKLRLGQIRTERDVLEAAMGGQRQCFQSVSPFASSVYSCCSLTHEPISSPMIPIKVPQLGESIVEATVARWLKKEGEPVAAGETLVELETDKITVEVPALKGGVLAKRLRNEGDVVKVDDVLAELDDQAAGVAAQPAQQTAAASSATQRTAPTPAPTQPAAPPQPAARAAAAANSGADAKASPAARKIAAEERIDLSAVAGTGRGGLVRKPDVLEHLRGAGGEARDAGTAPPTQPQQDSPPQVASPRPPAQGAPARAPSPAPNGARETREKMSTRRRRIAEHLLESQHATAHLTTFNEIDMSAVEALRARVKERIEKEHGVRLSVMPFFVKAACKALEAHPVVNASVDGDTIVYHQYVNMGIAVASDAGLVVPNIKDAHAKGLLDIARDIVDIAKRAREGKLAMDDLTGGTFTITNGGVFGSLVSTPIINYPQSGILGLHKIQQRPVAIDGRVEIRPMMYVALSYDHRIIDGQQAVLFLVRVKELMEDPATMLIE
jgi:2-oxoglutarate dehydrogenase E2 component (dihydrolipoamide succinyltransferase)